MPIVEDDEGATWGDEDGDGGAAAGVLDKGSLDAARLLARAGDVLSRQARFYVDALTYAGVCWRMLTILYACRRRLVAAGAFLCVYAEVCWRMLAYAAGAFAGAQARLDAR